MNTNNVFIVKTFLCTNINFYGTNIYNCGWRYSKDYEENRVVYRKKLIDKCIFIDLFTRERYSTDLYDVKIGDRFIDFDYEMIPINDIIGIDKKHMSKKRILEKTISVLDDKNQSE